MSRRVRVPRSVEEKWEIVEEGLRSGNIAETCRRYGIAPNLFYRRKDEAQQGVMAALGGEERCHGGERAGAAHPAIGAVAGTEDAGGGDPKKRCAGVSCGETHSRARELVVQGYQARLVAAALAISRSSLYYRKRARGSRADRRWDEEIVTACGAKPAYGYRRVSWWLRRKEGLVVNRNRVLRVMRERGLLVRSRRLRAHRQLPPSAGPLPPLPGFLTATDPLAGSSPHPRGHAQLLGQERSQGRPGHPPPAQD